ncbi:hypothetical protein AB6A40_001725 [Gnathostoma spinigerum]|uniref:N-acetyltransferase domain-containing protein n=1 Tax=Gnathostoma spinigerum TaxID=75299 RepID=A0ABD6E775_9BILA
MELAVDLSSLFGSSLVKLDAMRIKQFHDAKLYAAIDDFCILASHSSQSHRTLTTCDKLMRSDHTLYLLWEPSTYALF